jgi:hypothetical protein
MFNLILKEMETATASTKRTRVPETKVPETKAPETNPEVKAIAIKLATELVETTRADWEEAKAELRKLTGKPATKTDKGPGVISTIFDLVKSSKKGISKEEILSKLTELFPDREKEGMSKTISVQLPARMSKERKVKIVKSEDGKFSIK